MKTKTLLIIGGLAAAYMILNSSASAAGSSSGNMQTCQYPDGTTVQVPSGNSCPFDSTHGGQSSFCYPSTFIGPLPPGGAGYCSS